jgi:hypothetical protein
LVVRGEPRGAIRERDGAIRERDYGVEMVREVLMKATAGLVDNGRVPTYKIGNKVAEST